ncbi:RNA polymerase sigma factor [Dyadobacter sp. CY323]|uniref:RNA polymerase sigma factor n=1 Tax=Dyadobacter sp. CY323 TaxID=2907302 RepID=UPI001F46E2E6|nr:sigma-70 family RNA polymerase sigma factor [Dyadobacter sp. CY323]MCE6988552.1 sigma-70 family RNA polymerase sigma factor [Dyadobacter sp. CY323]
MYSTNSSADKLLWQAFKLGDEDAYTRLYQKYVRVLFSYGKKILTDDSRVEDIVQDLFIDLWQSRARLADVENPRFYLFSVLRRRILKSLSKEPAILQDWEFTDEEILPVSLPEEFYIIEAEGIEKQKHHLDTWLKSLPVRQYEVLMLRYYQDFSYQEIAAILSINEQSVRNLITRALEKLRQLTVQMLIVLILSFF